MIPDSPTPREQLEVKLTALLLGELPAEEAAVLREQIAQDTEFAKLYARLEHTIGLVRETAATPAEQEADQPTPLRLSDERREKLQARFKTIAPKELKKTRRPKSPWLVPLAAAAAFVLLIYAVAVPNFVRSRTTSTSNTIVNNLRQIESAKEQWALEHNKSAADQPTPQEIASYLRGNARPVAGETYKLGKVGEPVVAELESPNSKSWFNWAGTSRSKNSGKQISLSSDGSVTTSVDEHAARLPSVAALARAENETVHYAKPSDISKGLDKLGRGDGNSEAAHLAYNDYSVNRSLSPIALPSADQRDGAERALAQEGRQAGNTWGLNGREVAWGEAKQKQASEDLASISASRPQRSPIALPPVQTAPAESAPSTSQNLAWYAEGQRPGPGTSGGGAGPAPTAPGGLDKTADFDVKLRGLYDDSGAAGSAPRGSIANNTTLPSGGEVAQNSPAAPVEKHGFALLGPIPGSTTDPSAQTAASEQAGVAGSRFYRGRVTPAPEKEQAQEFRSAQLFVNEEAPLVATAPTSPNVSQEALRRRSGMSGGFGGGGAGGAGAVAAANADALKDNLSELKHDNFGATPAKPDVVAAAAFESAIRSDDVGEPRALKREPAAVAPPAPVAQPATTPLASVPINEPRAAGGTEALSESQKLAKAPATPSADFYFSTGTLRDTDMDARRKLSENEKLVPLELKQPQLAFKETPQELGLARSKSAAGTILSVVPPAEEPPAIDPSTGLPIAPAASPVPAAGGMTLTYEDPEKFVPRALASAGGNLPAGAVTPLPSSDAGSIAQITRKMQFMTPGQAGAPVLGDLPITGRTFSSDAKPATTTAPPPRAPTAMPGIVAGKPVADANSITLSLSGESLNKKLSDKSDTDFLSINGANTFGGRTPNPNYTRSFGYDDETRVQNYINDGTVTLGYGATPAPTSGGNVDTFGRWNLSTGAGGPAAVGALGVPSTGQPADKTKGVTATDGEAKNPYSLNIVGYANVPNPTGIAFQTSPLSPEPATTPAPNSDKTSIARSSTTRYPGGSSVGDATFTIDQDARKVVVLADSITLKHVSEVVDETKEKQVQQQAAKEAQQTASVGSIQDADIQNLNSAMDSLYKKSLRSGADSASRHAIVAVDDAWKDSPVSAQQPASAPKYVSQKTLDELGRGLSPQEKEALRQRLDVPTRQVLIEATLLEADTNSLAAGGINWANVPKRDSLPVKQTYATATNAVARGREVIAKKLNQINLGTVKSDGMPLAEVINALHDESKKGDPDKTGVNFIITPGLFTDAAKQGAIDPSTGLPAAASGQADLGAVLIKRGQPLTNVRLTDALDAIVKAADKPIKYSIRDYGVVFEPATPTAKQEKEPDVAKQRRPATPAAEPQPEIQTCDNAFSTFSLNISDVSFKLAMASLEKGQMPDAASVRSEEFLNAFDYRDPEPPPSAPIGFAWERARYPFAQNRDLIRFSLKTAAQGRQAGRPMNIVLLLDNSGSMERADRVQIIREALRVLASQLQPRDKLSVITFARTARLVADGVSGSEAAKVVEEVSGLTPQGGTNLEDAMNTAYATALRHYVADGINRVVLLTDGAANLGNVEPEELKQKVEAHRKQGVALDCFGIGWEGYNDDLLEVLSRNGDGRYGFIDSPEEAATEFAGQIAGALHVAASDVKVQVEFNPKRVTAYRQIGYAKHQLKKEQFRDNTVDAAEIAAQEAGNALYVIEVNPRGEGPLGTVRVRYKVPNTSDYHEHEWEAPYAGNAVALDQASPAMRLAASASAFSEWLVSSPYAGEVTPDSLLSYMSGVPEVYGADGRPKKLEWMIRQAKSVVGK